MPYRLPTKQEASNDSTTTTSQSNKKTVLKKPVPNSGCVRDKDLNSEYVFYVINGVRQPGWGGWGVCNICYYPPTPHPGPCTRALSRVKAMALFTNHLKNTLLKFGTCCSTEDASTILDFELLTLPKVKVQKLGCICSFVFRIMSNLLCRTFASCLNRFMNQRLHNPQLKILLLEQTIIITII